jgi:hypothetical protein
MSKSINHKKNNYWDIWKTECYDRLQKELALIESAESATLVKIQSKLELVRKVLAELREEVQVHGFSDQLEEIAFMKEIKHLFLSIQLFQGEVLLLEINLPKGTTRQKLNYYLDAFNCTNWFFNMNCGLYQYYQLGATELDQLYFLRGTDAQTTLHLAATDPVFGTPVSDLFARFMATEKLREYILNRIRALECIHVLDNWQPPFTGRRLKWTGNLVDLTELILGLYYTGQLNNGQASLGDIVRFFEDIFQVEIKNIYKTYGNIRKRKRLTTTHLIDNMRNGILTAIDDSLTYKPTRQHIKN